MGRDEVEGQHNVGDRSDPTSSILSDHLRALSRDSSDSSSCCNKGGLFLKESMSSLLVVSDRELVPRPSALSAQAPEGESV